MEEGSRAKEPSGPAAPRRSSPTCARSPIATMVAEVGFPSSSRTLPDTAWETAFAGVLMGVCCAAVDPPAAEGFASSRVERAAGGVELGLVCRIGCVVVTRHTTAARRSIATRARPIRRFMPSPSHRMLCALKGLRILPHRRHSKRSWRLAGWFDKHLHRQAARDAKGHRWSWRPWRLGGEPNGRNPRRPALSSELPFRRS